MVTFIKHTCTIILSLYLATSAFAQRYGVREEVLGDWNKCSGLDCVYDIDAVAAESAPKGYEAFYVSHYGRHGSRYAYTADAYKTLLDMLRKASQTANLTEYGVSLLEQMEILWSNVQYKVGDLSPMGWKQQQRLASRMAASFPKAFGKGSYVDACASTSLRSVMSMSSFCLGLAKDAPSAEIFEHQTLEDVKCTAPNMGNNPWRYASRITRSPFQETPEEFFARRFPEYVKVLGRMFKDTDKALEGRKPLYTFYDIYMLVGGMNSIPEDVRIDLGGVFTPEEFAAMWECDNYLHFHEYLRYIGPCCAVVDDIIAKADARIKDGVCGADLRFGHDHVMMPLMVITDIDGFGTFPDSPDDLALYYQTFRSPMATNLQLVFYRSKCCRKGDILVKVLHNGEAVKVGSLPEASAPGADVLYYNWSELREYLLARVDKFAIR